MSGIWELSNCRVVGGVFCFLFLVFLHLPMKHLVLAAVEDRILCYMVNALV